MKKIFRTLVLAASLATSFTAFAQDQEIRLFSHRGGRLEHDENTMYAFEKSYEAGYRGYETDIRLTSDGKLVLFHDNSLDRCTNATGSIEEKTMKEVAAIRTKAGRPLCTLQEFVDFFKNKHNDDLYIEFEIKTNEKLYTQEKIEEICDKIYKMVTANKPEGAVYLFTSGDYRALRYLQQKYKTTDMLLITSKPVNDETIALCKAMGITRLGAKMEGTSRATVKKAKEAGLTVSLWPGLCVEDLMLGAYLGAEYMCTDRPLEYMKFCKEKAPWLKVRY